MFNYYLNNKRAKAKLLTAAKKEKNLDIDIKPGFVNLRFNNGSYHEVILPCPREGNHKVDQVIKIDDTEPKIIEVGEGKESILIQNLLSLMEMIVLLFMYIMVPKT